MCRLCSMFFCSEHTYIFMDLLSQRVCVFNSGIFCHIAFPKGCTNLFWPCYDTSYIFLSVILAVSKLLIMLFLLLSNFYLVIGFPSLSFWVNLCFASWVCGSFIFLFFFWELSVCLLPTFIFLSFLYVFIGSLVRKLVFCHKFSKI